MKQYLVRFACVTELVVTIALSAGAQWIPTNGPCHGNISSFTLKGDTIFAIAGYYNVFRSANNGTTWTDVTNGLPDYSNLRLAVCDGALFATTRGDSIFRSADNGTHWKPVNFSLAADDDLNDLAVSGSTLFAGTNLSGIFKSVDNGISWINAAPYGKTSAIYRFYFRGSNLFASTGKGILRSTDNGTTWTFVGSGIIPISNSFLLVGDGFVIANNEYGTFRSTDNGTSWTAGDTSGSRATDIAVCGTTFFAATSGIRTSTDNGATWTTSWIIDTTCTNLRYDYSLKNRLNHSGVNALAVCGGGIVLAGTQYSGIIRSIDNGTNWTTVLSSDMTRYVQTFTVKGNVVFAGTEKGAFLSIDNGASWTAVNSGFVYSPVRALITDDGGNIFAGTDSAEIYHSANKGSTWKTANSGLILFTGTPGRALAINGTNLFAGTWDGISLSTDTGRSWNLIESELGFEAVPDFEGQFIPIATVYTFAFRDSTIFAGTRHGIFQSTNNGTNWIEMDSSLKQHNIYSLALKNDILFGGTDGGVVISTGNGAPGKFVNFGLTTMRVQSLAVIGSALFAGSTYNGVFLSTDNGASWNAINTGLANTCVFALAAHDSMLFAGTYGEGIFLSTNRGTSWNIFNTGLTDLHVASLAVSDDDLYAGTENSGVWRRPLSETAIIADRPKPQETSLQHRFDVRAPGPANHNLTVAFYLPRPDRVSVTLYSVSGKLTATVVDRRLEAGSYCFQLDCRTTAPGCYLVRIQEGNAGFSKIIRRL